MLPACIAQFFASWLSLMTSGLASASPGRAARPSKTPHVHVRVSTISFSFALLSGSRKNSSARRAPLNALYTRAKKNNMRRSKRWALLLFQNRTVMGSLRCHKSRSARHVAALHRVAPDLQITLRGFPRLRRIAEQAAALAAEALEARRGRSFHEIVIGVLLGDLVDHACALVEELLLAGVRLHALEDVLDPVYGGIGRPVSGLGRGTPRQHRQGKRHIVGRLHAFRC